MFDLTIRTIDGQNHLFQLPESINVRALKEHISSSLNIPPEQQRIIYQGRILPDEQVLAASEMHGHVMHLVRQPEPTSRSPPHSQQPRRGSSVPFTSRNRIEGVPVEHVIEMHIPDAGISNLTRNIVNRGGFVQGIPGARRMVMVMPPTVSYQQPGGATTTTSSSNATPLNYRVAADANFNLSAPTAIPSSVVVETHHQIERIYDHRVVIQMNQLREAAHRAATTMYPMTRRCYEEPQPFTQATVANLAILNRSIEELTIDVLGALSRYNSLLSSSSFNRITPDDYTFMASIPFILNTVAGLINHLSFFEVSPHDGGVYFTLRSEGTMRTTERGIFVSDVTQPPSTPTTTSQQQQPTAPPPPPPTTTSSATTTTTTSFLTPTPQQPNQQSSFRQRFTISRPIPASAIVMSFPLVTQQPTTNTNTTRQRQRRRLPNEMIKRLIDAFFGGQQSQQHIDHMTLESILNQFSTATRPGLDNFFSISESNPLHPSHLLQILFKVTFASLRSLWRNDLSDRGVYEPMISIINQLAERIGDSCPRTIAGNLVNYILLPWPVKVTLDHLSPVLHMEAQMMVGPEQVVSAFYLCVQTLLSDIIEVITQSCPLQPLSAADHAVDADGNHKSAAPDDLVKFYLKVSTLIWNFCEDVVVLLHEAFRDCSRLLWDLYEGMEEVAQNRTAYRAREFMSLFAGIILRYQQLNSFDPIMSSHFAHQRVERYLNAILRGGGPANLSSLATSDPTVNVDSVNIQARGETFELRAPSSDSYNQLAQGFDRNNGRSESDDTH